MDSPIKSWKIQPTNATMKGLLFLGFTRLHVSRSWGDRCEIISEPEGFEFEHEKSASRTTWHNLTKAINKDKMTMMEITILVMEKTQKEQKDRLAEVEQKLDIALKEIKVLNSRLEKV